MVHASEKCLQVVLSPFLVDFCALTQPTVHRIEPFSVAIRQPPSGANLVHSTIRSGLSRFVASRK